jgi:peptide/nickel transport system substrate-binding protein
VHKPAGAVTVIALSTLAIAGCSGGSSTPASPATAATSAAAAASAGATSAATGSSAAAAASTSASASTAATSNAPVSSTPLVVDTSFILKTVDPGRMFEPTGEMIDHALYQTLLTFAGGDVTKPVPDLATSYTASSDNKTFTFVLDPKAVFSDGTPVTSADVVFSLNRVVNLKGNPSFLLAGVTATAPDAHTVVLTSKTANPALPFLLPNPALGIVNSAAVKAKGGTDAANASTADKAEASLNAASEGSGPYVLTSFSTTSQVVLTANPKYDGKAVHYGKVTIRNVQSSVQKLNILKGESQVAIDLSADQATGMSGPTISSSPSPNVFFLFANQNPKVSAVTSNKDFVTAVRYGIDYAGLVNLAGKGAAQANGIVPSQFLGALTAGQGVTRDLAKAKAALAASGLKNPTVKLAYPSDLNVAGLSFGDLAARVQANLKDVGIKVVLAPASTTVALGTYRGATEQMGLWYWGPDYPDPSDYLAFSPGALVGLRAAWPAGADAAATTAANAAMAASGDARGPAYQAYQKELNTSSPFFPLIQPAQVLATAKSVTNASANAVWLVGLSELG